MELAPILSAVKELGIPLGLLTGTLILFTKLYVNRVTKSADERVQDYKERNEYLRKENARWQERFFQLFNNRYPQEDDK